MSSAFPALVEIWALLMHWLFSQNILLVSTPVQNILVDWIFPPDTSPFPNHTGRRTRDGLSDLCQRLQSSADLKYRPSIEIKDSYGCSPKALNIKKSQFKLGIRMLTSWFAPEIVESKSTCRVLEVQTDSNPDRDLSRISTTVSFNL
ncbi:hypothetical protein SAY87_005156 [Trapa incisa]|uniref:Uncharacterized protein n=1 Tax=Trapa incisa TaxID=236973 RepID=A0AAN7Q6H0_9MYRT|nr:hypothetical protein SAY87_005156 [Trapa incisa]